MFVAREEQEPLGGLFGLVLPSALLGAGMLVLPSLLKLTGVLNSISSDATEAVLALMSAWLGLAILAGRTKRWFVAIALCLPVAMIFAGTALLLTPPESPGAFWLGVKPFMHGFALYAGLVLVKTVVDRPKDTGLFDYRGIFINAVTLPVLLLIIAMAGSLLSITLSAIYSMLGIFQEGWQSRIPVIGLLPLLAIGGAVLGTFVAIMRMQRVVIGVMRYALLLIARFSMPVITVLSVVTVLIILLDSAGQGLVDGASPLSRGFVATLILLAFALIYQNGQTEKPPFWLRLAVWVSLLTLPIFVVPSVFVLNNETPLEQFYGAIILISSSIVAMVGLVSELYWAAQKWMPPVRHGFRIVWFVAALLPVALTVIR